MKTRRARKGSGKPNQKAPNAARIRRLRALLLSWADESGRHFFWREPNPDPFVVLVIEMLLTKTRAELVANVGRELVIRYPNPVTLSAARREDLERVLYPLGLHRKRSEQLIRCAKVLVDDFAGVVPRTVDDLMRLPYVGRYAANAVACVAFGEHVGVIDANVARIFRRMFSLPPPPERLATAHDLWSLADRMLPRMKAREFNWAILDLGGTVCMPKTPKCVGCPVASCCDFARNSSFRVVLASTPVEA